MEDILFYKMKI